MSTGERLTSKKGNNFTGDDRASGLGVGADNIAVVVTVVVTAVGVTVVEAYRAQYPLARRLPKYIVGLLAQLLPT